MYQIYGVSQKLVLRKNTWVNTLLNNLVTLVSNEFFCVLKMKTSTSKPDFYYYPQRAQRAVGIVRVWQIFGHGYDFTTWSEIGTKSKVKVPNFGGKKYLEEF